MSDDSERDDAGNSADAGQGQDSGGVERSADLDGGGDRAAGDGGIRAAGPGADGATAAKTIGASKVPAIMGTSPFTSVGDLWTSLKYGIRSEAGEAAQIGLDVEDLLLEYACDRLGINEDDTETDVDTQVKLLHPALPLHSTMDLVAYKRGTTEILTAIEAKTTGLAGPAFGSWGAYGTDEVPPWVYDQVQVQLMCSGLAYMFVAAWIGGIGIRLYRIVADQDRQDQIRDSVLVFVECLAGDTPPEGPSLAVARSIPKEKGKRKDLDPVPTIDLRWAGTPIPCGSMNIIEAHIAVSQFRKAVQQMEDEIKSAIMVMAEDATFIRAGDYTEKVTQYQVRTIKGEDLNIRYPDVYDELVRVSTATRLYPKHDQIERSADDGDER